MTQPQEVPHSAEEPEIESPPAAVAEPAESALPTPVPAADARFQQAIGDRFVVRVDGFLSTRENTGEGAGARIELVTQF